MAGEHKVRWLFHGTAMVNDYDATFDWLATYCGCRVLEYSEQLNPGIARRGGMTWMGDNSLELGQPIIPGAASARFVERFGPGVHSVALQIADIEATIAFLASKGVAAASRPQPEFILSDPRATDGVLFEWYAGKVKEDPRFDAPVPPLLRPPLLDVQRWAYIGAVVADPPATAAHFAELFGTAVTFEDPSAGPGRPKAGVSTNDCTLALFRLDAARSRELWGVSIDRPRAHLLAFTVPDLGTAADTLTRNGIAILRREEGFLLPRPDQTGDVPVAFTDRLLPRDPRGG